MKILVTNDDGVHSPGLWALAEALKDQGDVTVVAPDRDQSGVGAAMTLLDVVRAAEIKSPVEGIEAFAVQGTPADCVILATEALVSEPIDIVVSGINQGANLGLDIINSGTMGGAFQGFFRGKPSIAVSVTSLTDVRFEAGAQAAAALVATIAANGMSTPMLLNMNLPNIAADQIESVEVTKLGPRAYIESVERGHDGRRTHYWIRHNKPVNHNVAEGTDVWAVRNKRVSITPIHALFEHTDGAADLQAMADAVSSRLGVNGRS